MITVSQHVKNEWARMAQAAYTLGFNRNGHRYSAAASLPNGTQLACTVFDSLQHEYRAWLCFNEFAGFVS